MRQRSKRVSYLFSAVTIGAVAVFVLTMVSSSKSEKEHAEHIATIRFATSARLPEMFNVLDHRTSAHRASAAVTWSLPQSVANAMTSTHPELDPAAAVFAGGTYPTWVVPGTNEVCLIDGPTTPEGFYGGVCGSIAAAEHGIAVTTENANGEPVVIGLVPNGNTSVTVGNADGTVERLPVRDNVYESLGGDPSTVKLTEASGTHSTRHVASLSRHPLPSGTSR